MIDNFLNLKGDKKHQLIGADLASVDLHEKCLRMESVRHVPIGGTLSLAVVADGLKRLDLHVRDDLGKGSFDRVCDWWVV